MTKKQTELLNDYFIKIAEDKYHCLLKHYDELYTLKEAIAIIDSQ